MALLAFRGKRPCSSFRIHPVHSAEFEGRSPPGILSKMGMHVLPDEIIWRGPRIPRGWRGSLNG